MAMIAAVWSVVRRPSLWVEAVRTLAALAPDGWWRRAPYLPIPDRAYLRWRLSTAYGRPDAPIEARDLVAYLEWRRRERLSR